MKGKLLLLKNEEDPIVHRIKSIREAYETPLGCEYALDEIIGLISWVGDWEILEEEQMIHHELLTALINAKDWLEKYMDEDAVGRVKGLHEEDPI